MSKKLILVLVVVSFLSGFNLARAEVVINEFVSNPVSGSEWIELLNTTNNDVPLVGWELTDIAIPGGSSQHEVSNKKLDSLTILANAIIVIDVTDLNNDGDSIGLYNGVTLIDRVTYGTESTIKNYPINLAASLKGKSGALISSVWKTNQVPTKGTVNETITLPPPADDSNSNSSSSSSGSSSSSSGGSAKAAEIPKIKTQITAKTFGFVGLPLSLNATTFGLSGEQLRYGKYFWNFGDGDSKEVNLADSQPFTHAYFYLGDYVVSLDYFSNPYIYSDVPDAFNKITVKIISADISISRVGEEKDFFVELSNNTDFSADLSNWFLASDTKSFTIPRNTILPSKKKMIISPKITNFSITDKDTLKLMTSRQEIVFDYSASNTPVNITPIVVLPTPSLILPLSKGEMPKAEGVHSKTEIPVENLPALALSGESAGHDEKSPYSFPIIPLASLVFIGASAGAVYFIRRKKVVPQAGDDFEILDE